MDEHSANVERAANEQGVHAARPGRSVVGRPGAPRSIGSASATTDSSGRPIQTTRARRSRWSRGRWPRATSTRACTRAGTARATTSSRPTLSSSTDAVPITPRSSSSGSRRRTGSSALIGVPGAARAALPRQSVVLRARALPQRGPGLAARGACATSRSAVPAAQWGIPFPDDPEHRIYVWFDALTNYITGAGFPDDMDVVRAVVAGRRAHHRQEHHPLPLPVLAGDADERRPAAAAPGLRPRLHARHAAQR